MKCDKHYLLLAALRIVTQHHKAEVNLAYLHRRAWKVEVAALLYMIRSDAVSRRGVKLVVWAADERG